MKFSQDELSFTLRESLSIVNGYLCMCIHRVLVVGAVEVRVRILPLCGTITGPLPLWDVLYVLVVKTCVSVQTGRKQI